MECPHNDIKTCFLFKKSEKKVHFEAYFKVCVLRPPKRHCRVNKRPECIKTLLFSVENGVV